MSGAPAWPHLRGDKKAGIEGRQRVRFHGNVDTLVSLGLLDKSNPTSEESSYYFVM